MLKAHPFLAPAAKNRGACFGRSIGFVMKGGVVVRDDAHEHRSLLTARKAGALLREDYVKSSSGSMQPMLFIKAFVGDIAAEMWLSWNVHICNREAANIF